MLEKTLVKYFNPLPQRADYFSGNVENMVYNSSTGRLVVDYEHILLERTSRLPLSFFSMNCSSEFTTIDGITLNDAYSNTIDYYKKIKYFKDLANKIKNDNSMYMLLSNRLNDAVKLSRKKANWNYRTALPIYYPPLNKMTLIFPLAISNPDIVDLALVVSRENSGIYQGQTVLPLDAAYVDVRTVIRPDSDWLQPSLIKNENYLPLKKS